MESCNYVNIPVDDPESVHIAKPVSKLDISLSFPTPEKKEESRCTCCNVCMFVALFLFGFFGLTMSVAYMCAVGYVQKYTVEYRPNLKLETVPIPEWEVERLNERVELFVDILKSSDGVVSPQEHFAIEEREVNGLVAHSDALSGHVFAHLEENKVSLDISMPTDLLPGGKGRRFVANQSVQWKEDSTFSLVTAVYSEKTAANAFSKESASSYNPGHAFSGEFLFRWSRTNDQRLVLDFEGGRVSSHSFVMEKKEDLLTELYKSDHADTQEFLHALNGIDKISLNDGQIIIYTKDGERRSLTAMDASSYLFAGISNIARRLVGI